MLDKLTSNMFAPLINQECRLVAADGTALDTILVSVKEAPNARDPMNGNRRMPFNLVFQSAADTQLADGLYAVRMKSLEVPEIFLARIANPGSNTGSRFQAVFT